MPEQKISRKEILEAWAAAGRPCSRQYLSKLVERGMPETSIADATKWRDENASRREGPPKPGAKKKAPVEEGKRGRGRPRKNPHIVAPTGDSLLDALNSAISVQQMAYAQVTDAVALKKTTTLAPLVSIHNKALEARFSAETMYRKELESRGLLVDKQAITEKCRRCLDTVLRRMRKLPNEAGPQCNEQEPLKATAILQRSVDEIISAGMGALRDL